MVSLCPGANPEMVPKFQVAAAGFSCSPPDLNESELLRRPPDYAPQSIRKPKFCGLCPQWFTKLTIITCINLFTNTQANDHCSDPG
jgi:hypothetical protein